MPDSTFTFRVEEELKTAFAEAAKAHDRPGSQLLRDFQREYVEKSQHDAWLRSEVGRGLKELADLETRLIPHAQVEVASKIRRTKMQKRTAANRKR